MIRAIKTAIECVWFAMTGRNLGPWKNKDCGEIATDIKDGLI